MTKYTVGPGRVLERDGVPILDMSRSHLGDGKYALRPTEADDLVRTIAALLNGLESMTED